MVIGSQGRDGNSDSCDVKGCSDKDATAILGLHNVCGKHYYEWHEAHHIHHTGNEWFNKNITGDNQ